MRWLARPLSATLSQDLTSAGGVAGTQPIWSHPEALSGRVICPEVWRRTGTCPHLVLSFSGMR